MSDIVADDSVVLLFERLQENDALVALLGSAARRRRAGMACTDYYDIGYRLIDDSAIVHRIGSDAPRRLRSSLCRRSIAPRFGRLLALHLRSASKARCRHCTNNTRGYRPLEKRPST